MIKMFLMNFRKIESLQNPKVKYAARLQKKSKFRSQENKIFLEGWHLLDECFKNDPCSIETIFLVPELLEKKEAEILKNIKAEIFLVSPGIMGKISSTSTFTGIVGIAARPEIQQEKEDFVLFLEAIQDPGNLGTIVRTASAAGVDAIFCDRKTTDPWSSKVLRSAMGGHFRVAIKIVQDLEKQMQNFEGEIFGTFMQGKSLFETDFPEKTAFVLGNEGGGISKTLEKHCTQKITIPMRAGVESLNVGIAGGLCFYEYFRQHYL